MKTTAYTLRLDDDQARQLTEMAARFRVKDVDIIRWAIDALAKYVEHHKGHLHLPIDFDSLWTQVKAAAPTGAMEKVLNPKQRPVSVASTMLIDEPVEYKTPPQPASPRKRKAG